MEKEEHFLCSLCLCPILNGNYEEIGNNTKEVLDIIFTNGHLQLNEGQFLCQHCSHKIKNSFNFKCTCIYTEDFIAPFVSKLEGSQIDLWEIFKRENLKDERTIADNQKVCRLCLQIIKGPAKSLLVQSEFDMIGRYMPEIMIHNTSDPVACEACLYRLHEFVAFVIVCVNRQEKKNKTREDEVTYANRNRLSTGGYKNSKECLETNKYDVNLNVDQCKEETVNGTDFYSGTVEDTHYCSGRPYPLSISPLMPSCDKEGVQVTTPIVHSTNSEESDDKCSVFYDMDLQIVKNEVLDNIKQENEIPNKRKPQKPLNKHQDLSKTKTYDCQHCDYSSKYPNALKSHMLNHTDPSDIKFYHCDLCNYKTKYKNALKSHKLNHKSTAEIKMRKCNQCSYETKHRTALVTHMLKHKKPSEIQMYKCDKCKFQTKFKQALKPHKRKHQGDTHKLDHKSPVEIKKCKCNEYLLSISPSMPSCNKEGLQVTTPIVHSTDSEDTDDKCSVFYDLDLQIVKNEALDIKQENEIPNKRKPQKPLNKHQDLSKTKMYDCQHCDYSSKYPNALKSHMLNHTDPSDIKFYHCDLCNYKTKYKNALKSHKLNHKSTAEIKMRKCNQCSYETKHRTALVTHMLKHKKPSEIQMYKCDKCKFQTKFKQALKPHKLKHQDAK